MANSIDAVKQLQNEIDKLTGQLVAVNNEIVKISKSTREVGDGFRNIKTPNKVNDSLKKTAGNIETINALYKQQDSLEKNLINTQAKQKLAVEGTNKAYVKSRFELQQQNKLVKEAVIISNRYATLLQKTTALRNKEAKVIQDLNLKKELGNKLSDREQKELKQSTTAFNKYDKAIKKAKNSVGRFQENVGNYPKSLGGVRSLTTGLIGAFGVLEGLKIGFDFGKESIKLAKEAKGVRFAFKRLGDDGVKAFDSIKKATKGTLSDLEIQKSLNEFNNLGISLEASGVAFEFLAVRAAQTGRSVESMREDLVTGLGRGSVKILDNLGLSMAELNKLTKEQGLTTQEAFGVIAKNEIAKAGNILDEATSSQEKFNAAIDNLKVNIGSGFIGNAVNSMYDLGTNIIRAISPTEKLTTATEKQRNGLNGLVGSIIQTNKSEEDRTVLIDDMIEKYPFFLKFIKGEKTDNDSLRAALKEVNKAYVKRIALQGVQQKLDKAQKFEGQRTGELAKEQVAFERYLTSVATRTLKNEDFIRDSTKETSELLIKELEKRELALAKQGSAISSRGTRNLKVYQNTLEQIRDRQKTLIGKDFDLTLAENASTIIKKDIKDLERVLGITRDEIEELFGEGNEVTITGKLKKEDESGSVSKRNKAVALGIDLEKERNKQLKIAQDSLSTLKDNFKDDESFRLNEIDQTALDDFIKIQIAKDDIQEGIGELAGTIEEFTGVSGDKFLDFYDKISEGGEKTFEDLADIAASSFSLASDVSGAFFQSKIDGYEADIEANNEYYANLLDNENLSDEEKERLETDRNNKAKKLRKEQAKEKEKQFQINKLFRIGEIIADTASAIVKTGASLGYPAAIPFQIQAGILGAAQLAIVAAQSPPKFKDGHLQGTYEGAAIINDANGSNFMEVVERRDGTLQVYEGRNQMIHMDKGDKVHKAGSTKYLDNVSDDELIKNIEMHSILASINRQNIYASRLDNKKTADLHEISADRIVKAIKSQKTKFNLTQNINLADDLRYLDTKNNML